MNIRKKPDVQEERRGQMQRMLKKRSNCRVASL
jgi:hypothetical protein